MADVLWTWHHDVPWLFCAAGHDEGLYRSFFAYAKLNPMARVFSTFIGGSTEPF